MILVDTSVWVDHFRRADPGLVELLGEGLVLRHPLVIEELACGHLSKRAEILGLLEALPEAALASHEEVLNLVSAEKLFGAGIGAVDAHLLASARLTRARLWTRDKNLLRAATRLKLSISEPVRRWPS